MSDLQWVTNLQLPFLSWKAVIQRDPQICARDIAKVLPINDYLPLGLSELESRSGYSRLVLQHLFLRHFGCTPRQWIHRERLRRAERSLKA